MAKGGPRNGAGRPKGTKNVKRKEIAAEAIEAGMSPLEYMLLIMRDGRCKADRRDRMAAAAAPFIHPRLANSKVEVKLDAHETETQAELELRLAAAGLDPDEVIGHLTH